MLYKQYEFVRLLNEEDRELIKNMEEGQIYHEHQPDEPRHDRQFCDVCRNSKRYRELVAECDSEDQRTIDGLKKEVDSLYEFIETSREIYYQTLVKVIDGLNKKVK